MNFDRGTVDFRHIGVLVSRINTKVYNERFRRSFHSQHSTLALHNFPTMTSASSTINLSSDSDDEIQIVTMWDREVRKEDINKIAYSTFLGRKYDSPSLSE